MTMLQALHGLHAILDGDPAYAAIGSDTAETRVIVYARGPIELPTHYGGFPVEVKLTRAALAESVEAGRRNREANGGRDPWLDDAED